MKRIQNIIFFILLFFLLSSCDWYLKSQVGLFRVKFYNLIDSQKYREASSLFYYPDYLSKNAMKNEQTKISKAIKIVSDELGRIRHTKEVPDEGRFKIIISLSDSLQINEQPFWAGGTFPVDFERAGLGWIEVDFVKESWNSFSIRKIVYESTSFDRNALNELYSLGIEILVRKEVKNAR